MNITPSELGARVSNSLLARLSKERPEFNTLVATKSSMTWATLIVSVSDSALHGVPFARAVIRCSLNEADLENCRLETHISSLEMHLGNDWHGLKIPGLLGFVEDQTRNLDFATVSLATSYFAFPSLGFESSTQMSVEWRPFEWEFDSADSGRSDVEDVIDEMVPHIMKLHKVRRDLTQMLTGLTITGVTEYEAALII